jgi:hypothetical protein
MTKHGKSLFGQCFAQGWAPVGNGCPPFLKMSQGIFCQRVHIMDGTTSVSLVTEGSSGLSRAHAQNRFDIDLFAIHAPLLTAAFHSKHRHPVCQLVTFRSHMCAYMG